MSGSNGGEPYTINNNKSQNIYLNPEKNEGAYIDLSSTNFSQDVSDLYTELDEIYLQAIYEGVGDDLPNHYKDLVKSKIENSSDHNDLKNQQTNA